jgi:spermidine synthase
MGAALHPAGRHFFPMSSRSSLVLIWFGLLSLLSAFLLFQVQPIISKFILPWFGGSPGVWTTCMLFFQLVLFGGYAYAHLLTKLPHAWQGILHGILVLTAAALLPITPAESWKPAGDEEPMLRILLLLAATVGLPYFILSSTSPLVQVWFTRATGGGSPWRLYALSNVGSLAALLSYPFFFEVRWDVTGQTNMWSAAFVLFALLSAWMAWRDRQLSAGAEMPPPSTAADTETTPPDAAAPTLLQRISWLLLPALASVLLLATTNHVCQDVAVIPFLWVVPLSLYLITFIICFEHERWYQPAWWALAAAFMVFAAAVYGGMDFDSDSTNALPFGWTWGQILPGGLTYKLELFICFAAMFLGVMVCHGELTRAKPAPRHLTSFYLTMSAGGALGGLLVSLVAPRFFNDYREWPLGLLTVFVLAAGVWIRQLLARRGALGVLSASAAFCLLCGGLWGIQHWSPEREPRIEQIRNFYGVISVAEEEDYETGDTVRQLYHGGIMHGMQRMALHERNVPYSYYGEYTGSGMALARAQSREQASVGVVGMGTASALCYGKKNHRWRFYEINPEIVRFAKTHFTYIPDFIERGGLYEEVIGDGRLALEREPSQGFDVLLLDAFSGDSVPMHLLTLEAFQIYDRHLKEDGIIVVNCTNRYILLASVIEKIAQELGFETTRIGTDWDGYHEITDYVLVTRDQAFIRAHPPSSPWEQEKLEVSLWTDQRHNLFEILEKD